MWTPCQSTLQENKIVKVNSFIKTLRDAMNHAAKIDQESRQAEVMRSRRNASSTAIDTAICSANHGNQSPKLPRFMKHSHFWAKSNSYDKHCEPEINGACK